MSAVALSGVSAAYDERTVLSEVDLDVAVGEWVAIVGPNGAGKSTLLRCVSGEVRPTQGLVRLFEKPSAPMRRRHRAALVAVVPQDPVIPMAMEAIDYVLLGRTPHLSYLAGEGPEDLASARRALRALDAEDLARRPMGTLSGGERRRMVLARAICQEAPILLLDEPTAALDIGHQQQVFELVDELRLTMQLTVLSAVHDLTMAAAYAGRVVMLDGGQIVAMGEPAEVLTPAALRRFGGANTAIVTGPDGNLLVVPQRPQPLAAPLKREPTK